MVLHKRKHIFRSGGKAKSDNHLKPVIFWGKEKWLHLWTVRPLQHAAVERVNFAVVNNLGGASIDPVRLSTCLHLADGFDLYNAPS